MITVAENAGLNPSNNSYSVVLTSQPASDVSVVIATDPGQVTSDKHTLLFPAADWNKPQLGDTRRF